MECNLVTGIIISEFDDRLGPVAKYFFPEQLSTRLLDYVARISLDTFYNDDPFPQNPIFFPFPQFNYNGIIQLFELHDPARRGGIDRLAITILFEEKDDPIFYQYLEDFTPLFGNLVEILGNLICAEINPPTIINQLIQFEKEIKDLLESLSENELLLDDNNEFPVEEAQRSMTPDYSFKLIVIGDPHVGKSSMILRYTDKAFRRSYIPTIGVNITQKNIQVEQHMIQLILWDIAGQTKYEHFRQDFYSGSTGALLVFDRTSKKSFENIRKWFEDLKKNVEDPKKLQIILCGNKSDKITELQVSSEEGIAIAQKLNIEYMETSALTGKNITESFTQIANNILSFSCQDSDPLYGTDPWFDPDQPSPEM